MQGKLAFPSVFLPPDQIESIRSVTHHTTCQAEKLSLIGFVTFVFIQKKQQSYPSVLMIFDNYQSQNPAKLDNLE